MIFLCYRRSDSEHATARICEALRSHFGRSYVIRDVDTIPLGEDWRAFVLKTLKGCKLMLAVIGERWLVVTDDQGIRRLEQASDPIFCELQAARELDLRVIPIRIDGAIHPPSEAMPPELRWLSDLSSSELAGGARFESDIDRLRADIEKLIGQPRRSANSASQDPGSSNLRTQVRQFVDSFVRCHGASYESTETALADPGRLFVPPRCESHHDGEAPPCDALGWLLDGVADGKAQLVLSNYGMGKSFLALRLQHELLNQFLAAPESARIPVVLPLKRHRLVRSDPDAVLSDLFEIMKLHGLPVDSRDSVKEWMREGRLCVILDGLDEIPMVQTADPLWVLERLDVRRFGDCPWIATSRSGLFAAVVDQLREKRTYRLAHLLPWRESDWRTYVYKCHDDRELGIFDSADDRDRFLARVSASASLSELTRVPLHGRMLVEAREIVGNDTVSRLELYRAHSQVVLGARQDQSQLPDLSDRIKCLQTAALFMFQESRLLITPDQLLEIAQLHMEHVSQGDLAAFVRFELQMFSMLSCNERNGTLTFSHKSFYEYFLARALYASLLEEGWNCCLLFDQQRMEPGEAEFLGDMVAGPESTHLLESLSTLLKQDNRHLPPLLRRNLVSTAVGIEHALTGENSPRLLREAHLESLDLSQLNFSGLDLTGAMMHAVRATGADFSGARLDDCDLTGANLTDCNFSKASLCRARLRFSVDGAAAFLTQLTVTDATFDGIRAGAEASGMLLAAVQGDPSSGQEWRERSVAQILKGMLPPKSKEAQTQTAPV